MLDELQISSPKRTASREVFEQLYPYYAGFPESFAHDILSSSSISPGSLIYDPWNGSGTTTSTASRLGFPAIGYDLNPVMVIVAKARLLQASEYSCLRPLAELILERASSAHNGMTKNDPLALWFQPATARAIRSIEQSCRETLVDGTAASDVDKFSSLAAAFYMALFSVTRKMASTFRTSNPTWIRLPKDKTERIRVSKKEIHLAFIETIEAIRVHLAYRQVDLFQRMSCQIKTADATTTVPDQLVDCVLTSPPYCTRIDYTAATRVELAIIQPVAGVDAETLRSKMIGTTKVPTEKVPLGAEWGAACLAFLSAVREHPSKASSGYYYFTHVDYYDKMYRSIRNVAKALREKGSAILIVQDSFYKDLHNDLPSIVIEMAASQKLELQRRSDFISRQCMSRINSRAVAYGTRTGSTESVLCFTKQ